MSPAEDGPEGSGFSGGKEEESAPLPELLYAVRAEFTERGLMAADAVDELLRPGDAPVLVGTYRLTGTRTMFLKPEEVL